MVHVAISYGKDQHSIMIDKSHFCRASFLLGLASLSLFGGCALAPRHPEKTAFIAYWPPAKNDGRLRLAVKDNIDMKGLVTSAGSGFLSKNGRPAKRDAECLDIARRQNVFFVGKANLSEFAVAPSGMNEYFGTPSNPLDRWRKHIPGGSSCGSAVAVASGLADVAFGTDTAGSVRVPAACCGIVGLKTTHGLVSLKGVFPIEAKHLDTVGPMGKDVARTVRGMDLLQSGFAARYDAEKRPAGRIRIGRLTLPGTDPKIDQAVDQTLTKAGFRTVALGDKFRARWELATKDANTIAAAGVWMNDKPYASAVNVSLRTKVILLVGRLAYPANYQQALTRQRQWQKTLRAVFRKVDFIALPTLRSTPPIILPNLKLGLMDARLLDLQNTAAVNFAGNPALALPIPLPHGDFPVTSLQLVGPNYSEAALLSAGHLVEVAVKAGMRKVYRYR